jgi:hypothetical protein
MPTTGNHYSTGSAIAPPEGFKDPTNLTKVLRALLVLGIILSVIAIWSGWLEYEILDKARSGIRPSEAAAQSSDLRQRVVGIVQVGLFILTGIVFLVWIYRANGNARKLGAEGMTFTPGWSIGWYFIPIANLWKPFQSMKEIWKASKYSSQDWQNQASDPILGWWWTFWILSNVIGRVAFRMSTRAEELDELYYASIVTFISDGVQIPLYAIAIVLVSKIFEMQMKKVDKTV